jgi:hypothetical protein
VRTLVGRVDSLARQALQKPSPTAIGLFGQYVGLAVALVALVYTLTH